MQFTMSLPANRKSVVFYSNFGRQSPNIMVTNNSIEGAIRIEWKDASGRSGSAIAGHLPKKSTLVFSVDPNWQELSAQSTVPRTPMRMRVELN